MEAIEIVSLIIQILHLIICAHKFESDLPYGIRSYICRLQPCSYLFSYLLKTEACIYQGSYIHAYILLYITFY